MKILNINTQLFGSVPPRRQHCALEVANYVCVLIAVSSVAASDSYHQEEELFDSYYNASFLMAELKYGYSAAMPPRTRSRPVSVSVQVRFLQCQATLASVERLVKNRFTHSRTPSFSLRLTRRPEHNLERDTHTDTNPHTYTDIRTDIQHTCTRTHTR